MEITSKKNERYRPQFHFTANKNWISDPNGLVHLDGEYHLFFQHNPSGNRWGNMTWGHAISRDLVHWTQMDDAIKPFGGGTIFSGSAVVDTKNCSGLGTNGNTIIAAFTHAREPFGQSLAFSNDNGRTFKLYNNGTPVVPNQRLDNQERDPRIIWHEPTASWIMLLWVRQGQVRFFSSKNLIQWEHLSDFFGDTFFECPDLVELPIVNERNLTKWVLYDASFRYWIGEFDGRSFSAETGPHRGDYGANFYAAQTWSNTSRRRIVIGWMRGGVYPGMPFNQQMSFPCDLALSIVDGHSRLRRYPIAEVERLRSHHETIQDITVGPDSPLVITSVDHLLDITIRVKAPKDNALHISVDGFQIKLQQKQIRCGDAAAEIPGIPGTVVVRLLIDRTSLEVFVGCGEVVFSFCRLPSPGPLELMLSAPDGSIDVSRINVNYLASTLPA